MTATDAISVCSRPELGWIAAAPAIAAGITGQAHLDWLNAPPTVSNKQFTLTQNAAISAVRSTDSTSPVAIDGICPRDASLNAQRKYLLELEAGWDGYNAKQIAVETIDELYSDLKQALADVPCPAPDVIPGGDGSLQAEWHHNNIEVLYHLGPNRQRYLTISKPSGLELEFFGPHAPDALCKWAPYLVLAPSVVQLAA